MASSSTELPVMNRYLSYKEVAARLGVHLLTLKRMVKTDPSFPKRFKVSPGRVGFAEADLIAWLAKRVKE